MRWELPVEMDAREQAVAKDLKRIGKFYVFLREIRSHLFDDDFQSELEGAYGIPRGTKPLPPALLAMVSLLQAYDQVGDADAVVTAKMDKRWQLVLGTLGQDTSPFSQGVLVNFRKRLVAKNLDQKLLARTVAFARESGKFGWQGLKVSLDSSPLWGAGRVEDTWNLIGRATAQLLACASDVTGVALEKIAVQAKVTVREGVSLKAALDIDWDDEQARNGALEMLVAEAERLTAWILSHAGQQITKPPLVDALETLDRVMRQDLEPDPNTGAPRIKKGVAHDRMPSLGDKQMRHGRKSRSQRFNGYKRHVITEMDSRLIIDAMVMPANLPEHEATQPLMDSISRHGQAEGLWIDRGYLASPTVASLHAGGTPIYCKPWTSRNGDRFPKQDFQIDLKNQKVTCPAGNNTPIQAKHSVAKFKPEQCGSCTLRQQCTKSKAGRSISIHPQEHLLLQLREVRKTPEGRANLRKRTAVEHRLARVQAIQGDRARYMGTRKNTLDVRRCAAVANLQHLQAAMAA
jgi:hypothetical protein